MALKKKKSKKKQSPQEKIRNLIRNPATWLVAFILLFGTYHYGSIWIEKRKFEKLDKQAYQYIQSIAKKFPGEITREQYCGYSSAKFSKGSLGCSVRSELYYPDLSDAKEASVSDAIEETISNIGWGKYKKFKSYTGEKNDQRNINYNFKQPKHCSVSKYYEEKSLLVAARCSGNARAEHYPVREY